MAWLRSAMVMAAVASSSPFGARVYAMRDETLDWESDDKILLNFKDQQRTKDIGGPPSFFTGERGFTKDNPVLDHDNGGLELAQVWEEFMDERDLLGGEGPDRIEIFVRTMGSVDDGPGCTVAHAPLDDGDVYGSGIYVNDGVYDSGIYATDGLPVHGPALVWCPLYAMPEYVNSINSKTKVVVFIAKGRWTLTNPIPRIKHDVHIVGSDVSGRLKDFSVDWSKGVTVKGVSSNRATDPQRLRETFHERVKLKTSFVEQNRHEDQGVKYILSTVIDGGDEVGIWHFAPHLRVKMENLCMMGGSAEQGGAVYVEEMTRLPMLAGGSLKMVNCDLVHNHALFGGAIYSGSMGVDVDRTSFTGNLASSCGGAVYVVDGNPIHASFTIFSHNYDRCGRMGPSADAQNPFNLKDGKVTEQEATLLEKGNGKTTMKNPQQIDTSGAISIGRQATRDSPSDYRQERQALVAEGVAAKSSTSWTSLWTGFGSSLASSGGSYKPDEPWWGGCEELWQANSNGLDPFYIEGGGGGRGNPRTYRTDDLRAAGNGVAQNSKRKSRMSLSKKGREKQRLDEEKKFKEMKKEASARTEKERDDRLKAVKHESMHTPAAQDAASTGSSNDDLDSGPTTDLRGINEALGFAPKGSGTGAPLILKKGVYNFVHGKGLIGAVQEGTPPLAASYPSATPIIQVTVPTPISPLDGTSLGLGLGPEVTPGDGKIASASPGCPEDGGIDNVGVVYDDDLEDFALELDYEDDDGDMPSFGSGSPFDYLEQGHVAHADSAQIDEKATQQPGNGGENLVNDPSTFFGQKL